MAHLTEVHDSVLEMIVTFSTTPAAADNPVFVELERQARRWKRAADLKDIVAVESPSQVYTLTVELNDGRMITVVADFTADPSNPALTLDTTGLGWTISELEPSRAFRDALRAAHLELGAIGLTITYF
jgi:hypothetical protein